MVIHFGLFKKVLFIFIMVTQFILLPAIVKAQPIWMPEEDFQTFSKGDLKSINKQFVLPKGTRVKPLGYMPYDKKDRASYVEVLDGPYKGEKVFIYHNYKQSKLLDVTDYPRFTLSSSSSSSSSESSSGQRDNQTEAQTECLDGSCLNSQNQSGLQDWHGDSTQIVHEAQKNNPAVGARQTMALLYQTCDVLKLSPYTGDPQVRRNGVSKFKKSGNFYRKITNLNKTLDNHYYLNSLNNYPSPGCLDMRKTPPLFQYGGRPKIKSGDEIDLFSTYKNGGTNSLVGLDCSGFVSAALISAGLKIKPNADKAIQNITNTSALMGMNDSNSCFRVPYFSKNSTIMSGDLVVERGHVFMIDKVGPDPLGVEKLVGQGKLKKYEDCLKVDYKRENFEFSIIQSTGSHDLSASIMEARDWDDDNMYSNLFKTACFAHFKKDPIKMTSFTKEAKILRHKGDSQEGCQFAPEDKPTFKHSQCVGDCKEAYQ